jgi:hypothetical membrane protein
VARRLRRLCVTAAFVPAFDAAQAYLIPILEGTSNALSELGKYNGGNNIVEYIVNISILLMTIIDIHGTIVFISVPQSNTGN